MYEANFDWERHIIQPAYANTGNDSDGQSVTWVVQPLSDMPSNLADHNAKDEWQIRWYHSTTVEALQGILQSKALKTVGWEEDGAGHHGFYALAYVECNNTTDRDSAFRVISKGAAFPKNISGIIVEGISVGRLKSVKSGGIDEEARHVRPGVFTHYTPEHRWCVHPDSIQITGLVYTHNHQFLDRSIPVWRSSAPPQ
jgi:hypothetical protein